MNSVNLGRAVFMTVMDSSGLRSGLQDAERAIDQFGGRSVNRLARVGAIGTAALAGLGAAAVGTVGALITAANRTAAYADEVDKAALRTRLARSSVQELMFVTDQLGGSFAAVETAVQGMTMRLAGAEQGGERQAGAFAKLGIELRNTSGELRGMEDILFDSLVALQGVTNETERTVMAQEIFGRSAASLGPLLSAGAGAVTELRNRARELGLVLGDEQIRQLVAYKDSMSALQQQVSAISRELTISFVPVLTEGVLPAVQKALDLFRALPDPVQRGASALTAFGTAVGGIATALRLLGVPMAAMFGPAGLIIAGVGVVASLAFALAGGRGNKNTLEGAAAAVSEAVAGGNRDSIIGALDTLITKTDGDTKAGLLRLQEELRRTGQVGVEAMRQIAEAAATIDIDAQIAVVRARIAGLEAASSGTDISATPGRDVDGIFRGANLPRDDFRLDEALNAWVPRTQEVLDNLTAVQLDALARVNRDWQADTAQILASAEISATITDELARSYEQLNALEEQRAAALAGVVVPGVPPGGGGGGTDTGTVDTEATWQSVLAELDRQGTAAVNRAKFDGTAEAFLTAAELRFALIDAAITDLITNFFGRVPDEELEALRGRRDAAAADVASYRVEVDRTVPTPSDVAAITDEIVRSGLGFLDELGNFDVQAARAEQNARLASIRDDALDALNEAIAESAALRPSDVAGIADPLDRLPQVPGILDESGNFDIRAYRQAVSDLEQSVDLRLTAEAERIAAAALDIAQISDDRTPQVLDALGNLDLASSRRLVNERQALITQTVIDAAYDAAVEAVQQADLLRSFDVAGIVDPLDRPPVVLDEQGDVDLKATREARDSLLRSVDEQLADQIARVEAAALDIVGISDPLERPPRVLDAAGNVDQMGTRELEAEREEQIRVLQAVFQAEARVSQIRQSAAGILGTTITQEQAFINELEQLAAEMREVGADVLAEEIGLLADNIRDATDATAAAREENELRTGDSAERFRQGAVDFVAVIRQGYAESTREQVQSALSFASTIADAAVGFVQTISQLASGDLSAGQEIAALGGTVGSIVSLFDPVIGGLISIGSGLVGGIVEALFPGRNQQEEAERARGATPRGAPAIEFNLTVLQSLSVQSLTDPASRQAVNGLLNETVERITRVIEQNVIPRVSRLEAAVL